MFFLMDIYENQIFLTFANHSVFLGKMIKVAKSQTNAKSQKFLPQNPPGRVQRKWFLRERKWIHTQDLHPKP